MFVLFAVDLNDNVDPVKGLLGIGAGDIDGNSINDLVEGVGPADFPAYRQR